MLCAVLAGTAAAGEVYRCTENGKTVFSDRPCPGAVRVEGLPTDPKARANSPSTAVPTATATSTSGDTPQFDAQATGEDASIERNMADLARECTAGDPQACQVHRLNEGHYAANRERNARCASGEARACDEIRCLARSDREACARVD